MSVTLYSRMFDADGDLYPFQTPDPIAEGYILRGQALNNSSLVRQVLIGQESNFYELECPPVLEHPDQQRITTPLIDTTCDMGGYASLENEKVRNTTTDPYLRAIMALENFFAFEGWAYYVTRDQLKNYNWDSQCLSLDHEGDHLNLKKITSLRQALPASFMDGIIGQIDNNPDFAFALFFMH